MNTYIFKTSATMKEYNRAKWWIDSNVITEKRITTDCLQNALQEYKALVMDSHYIDISNNAIKNKQPMYVDTVTGEPKQVGYVITGKTEFQDDSYRLSQQYIDLWVTVLTVIDTDFKEVV